jgi:hypothetical protein
MRREMIGVFCKYEIMSEEGGNSLGGRIRMFGGTEEMESAGIFFTSLH